MSLVDQQNIIDAIYTAINTSVGTSVGVFENEAPQDIELPLCIFTVVSDVVESSLSSCGDRQELSIQVNFYGEKKLGTKALRTISDALFNDLHRSSVNIVGDVSNGVVGTVKAMASVEEDIIEIRQVYDLLII